MKVPTVVTLISLSFMTVASAQVTWEFEADQSSIGVNDTINVSGKYSGSNPDGTLEVDTPIGTGFGAGTKTGESWGGTGLYYEFGGPAVTMTNVAVYDYNGADNTSAQFSADENGLGIASATGNTWHIDGDEGFVWQSSEAFTFEGIYFRGGSLGNATLVLSSSSWKNLTVGTLDSAVTYDSATRTFIIVGAGNSFDDGGFTASELIGGGATELVVAAGADFQITNHSSTSDGFAIDSLVFSAAVPEPSACALLTGCVGLVFVMTRRLR